jgi:hypothetical protein
MKKIGIITFQDANNFGAILQAYALCEYLLSKGHNAEVIDYISFSKSLNSCSLSLSSIKFLKRDVCRDWKVAFRFFYRLVHIILFPYGKRIEKIIQFRSKFMKLSKRYFSFQEIPYYDVFIVGSDQVWNSRITEGDPAYFLGFGFKSRTIAYAVSVGTNNLNNNDKNYLHNIINIDFISVRERQSFELLKKFTDKPIVETLDPVLLQTEDFWNSLANVGNPPQGKYVLVYHLHSLANLIDYAKKRARKLEGRVVIIEAFPSLLNRIRFTGVEYIYAIDPVDFVATFKGAIEVITDSYHGTAFSVIFKKAFMSLPVGEGGIRISSLLDCLDLKSRSLESCFETVDIDWINVMSLLNERRRISERFISTSLITK